MLRPTETFYKPFTKSGNLDQMAGLNSISIFNTGTTLVTVNSYIKLRVKVAPETIGGMLIDEGNENEINKTIYRIDFETGAGEVIVAFKCFKDIT